MPPYVVILHGHQHGRNTANVHYAGPVPVDAGSRDEAIEKALSTASAAYPRALWDVRAVCAGREAVR